MGIIHRLIGKKEVPRADLGSLVCDMHSHLIPGIDDGSPDIAMSLELVSGFAALGYRKLITTPHIMSDHYRNNPGVIMDGLVKLKAAVHEAGINMTIEAAAEYYIDGGFMDILESKELLLISEKYILLEMGFMAEPPSLKKVFFELQMSGYKPILAHPERYLFWHRDLKQYHDLCDRDVYLQLNINSLTGMYSPEVRRIAEYLVEKGLVSFIGSDCHHPGHLQMMEHARTSPALHRVLESGKLLNASL